MAKLPLTKTQIGTAFAVAIAADLIQIPVTAVSATGIGFIPGEFADFVLDCIVMVATSKLLGFHWMLLPTLVVEIIPGMDLLPTWTGCVGFVVWQRKREAKQAMPHSTIEGMRQAEIIGTTHAYNATAPPQIPIDAEVVNDFPPGPATFAASPAIAPSRDGNRPGPSVEQRLHHIKDMLDRNVITQAEYDAKRQGILGDI